MKYGFIDYLYRMKCYNDMISNKIVEEYGTYYDAQKLYNSLMGKINWILYFSPDDKFFLNAREKLPEVLSDIPEFYVKYPICDMYPYYDVLQKDHFI